MSTCTHTRIYTYSAQRCPYTCTGLTWARIHGHTHLTPKHSRQRQRHIHTERYIPAHRDTHSTQYTHVPSHRDTYTNRCIHSFTYAAVIKWFCFFVFVFFFFWKTCEIERNQDRKQSLSYQLPSDALGVLQCPQLFGRVANALKIGVA